LETSSGCDSGQPQDPRELLPVTHIVDLLRWLYGTQQHRFVND